MAKALGTPTASERAPSASGAITTAAPMRSWVRAFALSVWPGAAASEGERERVEVGDTEARNEQSCDCDRSVTRKPEPEEAHRSQGQGPQKQRNGTPGSAREAAARNASQEYSRRRTRSSSWAASVVLIPTPAFNNSAPYKTTQNSTATTDARRKAGNQYAAGSRSLSRAIARRRWLNREDVSSKYYVEQS